MIRLLIFLGLILLIESIILIVIFIVDKLRDWMLERGTKDESVKVIHMNFKERRRM